MDPDAVTREALRVEREQTQDFLIQAIHRAVSKTFSPLKVTCIFRPHEVDYSITVTFTHKGKQYQIRMNVPDKEIEENAKTVPGWKSYLTILSASIREALRHKLKEDGITQIEVSRGSSAVANYGRETVYEAGSYTPIHLRKELGFEESVKNALDEKKAEQAAIDSIKRTLAEQARSEEP